MNTYLWVPLISSKSIQNNLKVSLMYHHNGVKVGEGAQLKLTKLIIKEKGPKWKRGLRKQFYWLKLLISSSRAALYNSLFWFMVSLASSTSSRYDSLIFKASNLSSLIWSRFSNLAYEYFFIQSRACKPLAMMDFSKLIDFIDFKFRKTTMNFANFW